MPKVFLSQLQSALNNDPVSFISNAERNYNDELQNTAKILECNPDVKVVLLSGPSGSGKTTTANILCDMLNSLSRRSAVISLDDFFLNQNDYPQNENGEPDFESIFALDVPLVHSCIEDIVNSGKTVMPTFDFPNQRRSAATKTVDVGLGGIVIIEGIHALNPIISDKLNGVYKIFVSVSTGIKNDRGDEIISGIDIRMFRRVIRDSIYRGFPADNTLEIWGNVLLAEKKSIYPYKPLADCKINTFHCYEPFVYADYYRKYMKTDMHYIENSSFGKAFTTLKDLEGIDGSLVPDNSLLREFIPHK